MTYISDPHREALALIDRHGKEAVIHAAMKADARLEAGDMEGAYAWRRAIAAIGEMQAPSGTVH
jgi:hypothetical protein